MATALARVVNAFLGAGSVAQVELFIGITPDADTDWAIRPRPLQTTVHFCSSEFTRTESRVTGRETYCEGVPRVYLEMEISPLQGPGFLLCESTLRTYRGELVFGDVRNVLIAPILPILLRKHPAPWRYAGGGEKIASGMEFANVPDWIRYFGRTIPILN